MLQIVVDAFERRPIRGAPLPALPHQIVDLMRTARRTFHSVAGLESMEHVGQINSGVRRHSVGGDFPQQHAERPNVRFGAELVVRETFRSRPLDRELRA